MASGELHEKEDLPLEHADGSSGGNLQSDPVSVKFSESSPTSSGITEEFDDLKLQDAQEPNKSVSHQTHTQAVQDGNKNRPQDPNGNIKVGSK